jgi:hypothetical protein
VDTWDIMPMARKYTPQFLRVDADDITAMSRQPPALSSRDSTSVSGVEELKLGYKPALYCFLRLFLSYTKIYMSKKKC